MRHWIAEEVLDAITPSGQRIRVRAALGQPYNIAEDEWACPVTVEGIHPDLGDIHAASSLQALCLAASVLRQLLTAFTDEGGQLKYQDAEDAFDVNACFSGVGSRTKSQSDH
jgi:hypothetical protein